MHFVGFQILPYLRKEASEKSFVSKCTNKITSMINYETWFGKNVSVCVLVCSCLLALNVHEANFKVGQTLGIKGQPPGHEFHS